MDENLLLAYMVGAYEFGLLEIRKIMMNELALV
jgi:hypothetical protein